MEVTNEVLVIWMFQNVLLTFLTCSSDILRNFSVCLKVLWSFWSYASKKTQSIALLICLLNHINYGWMNKQAWFELDQHGMSLLKERVIFCSWSVQASSTMQALLLFTVDRDTHEPFGRHQWSNVLDAASLFQTNHVVHRNAQRESIFPTSFPGWAFFLCVIVSSYV